MAALPLSSMSTEHPKKEETKEDKRRCEIQNCVSNFLLRQKLPPHPKRLLLQYHQMVTPQHHHQQCQKNNKILFLPTNLPASISTLDPDVHHLLASYQSAVHGDPNPFVDPLPSTAASSSDKKKKGRKNSTDAESSNNNDDVTMDNDEEIRGTSSIRSICYHLVTSKNSLPTSSTRKSSAAQLVPRAEDAVHHIGAVAGPWSCWPLRRLKPLAVDWRQRL